MNNHGPGIRDQGSWVPHPRDVFVSVSRVGSWVPHPCRVFYGKGGKPQKRLSKRGPSHLRSSEPGNPENESTAPQVPSLEPGNPRPSRKLLGPALILLAALIAIAPQFIRGNSCGHDFDVHLVSWLDAHNAWSHGIFYPRWTPSPNYGAGEPRFVFYPPLTWMLGAALGFLMPWHFVPIALTFLCLAGAGLATRALALEACTDAVATLAGCASIFSGFALFTAYERAAFPEFTGGVWLPLLILFALRERQPSAPLGRRILSGSTVALTLALAAAWLSNPPLGVIASYLLAAVVLLAAIVRRFWAPALRGAFATVLGLGLTAFYWLPAALERRWVDIRQATDDPGYNFENNWLFARHANPDLAAHDAVLRQVSWIAVSMIAVAVASMLIAWRRRALPAEKSTGARRWWIPLAVIPVAVLFLLFPISRPVWLLLPEFRFLQYPWRWLEAVEAPMAIFFAAAVWPARRRARPLVLAACAVAFLAATAFAATHFFQVCEADDTVASTLADFRNGVGFEGMYEYQPPGADETEIATGMPAACLVADPTIELGKEDPNATNPFWRPDQHTCEAAFAFTGGAQTNPERRTLRATVSQPGYLILRLLSYPAWKIQLNGRPVASLPHRDDGLIVVPVPQGPIDLTIDWTTTPDVIAGRWIGAVSLLAFAAFCFLARSRRKPDREPSHSPVS